MIWLALTRAVDRRLVEASLGDAGPQVVGHRQRGNAAKERDGPDVGANPVGQALGPGRYGIGVARGAECCHEQRRRPHFACRPADHLQRRAGIVDEQPTADRRRTSRILRMGNLCPGIPRSTAKAARPCRFEDHATGGVTRILRFRLLVAIARNRWLRTIGTGGCRRLVSLVAISRCGHPR